MHRRAWKLRPCWLWACHYLRLSQLTWRSVHSSWWNAKRGKAAIFGCTLRHEHIYLTVSRSRCQICFLCKHIICIPFFVSASAEEGRTVKPLFFWARRLGSQHSSLFNFPSSFSAACLLACSLPCLHARSPTCCSKRSLTPFFPNFLNPLSLRNRETFQRLEYSYQTDLWAAGIVACELCGTRFPWDFDADSDIYHIREELYRKPQPQRPTGMNAEIWGLLREIFCDKSERITVEDALGHEFFDEIRMYDPFDVKALPSEFDAINYVQWERFLFNHVMLCS